MKTSGFSKPGDKTGELTSGNVDFYLLGCDLKKGRHLQAERCAIVKV